MGKKNTKIKREFFTCLICASKFKDKGRLGSHMLIHTNELLYSCPVQGCNWGQRHHGNVYNHAKSHHGLNLMPLSFALATSIKRLDVLKKGGPKFPVSWFLEHQEKPAEQLRQAY
jgi:uncharacterized Zn-finger protein